MAAILNGSASACAWARPRCSTAVIWARRASMAAARASVHILFKL